ncbi:calcium-binding protein [Natronococcus wangiae]|uniref:calcium-binding protein n=1 Tax=Natronococcus wangiae TaxID=3068275 RepID=UPI00273E0532|nr:calcium-binding protein [Natronococcus sp. AD5]
MAKSALAAGALTLGTATIGTSVAGAQDGEEVAVFADNYYPGADFDVLARLETSTTVDTLQVDDETVPEISQPDEWNGHIIRYNIGGESGGITTFLYIRGASLSDGDSGTIAEDASVLSSDLNLLSTSVEAAGDGEEPADNETADNETAGNESGGE